MTKATSEATEAAAPTSRIIAAEALQGAQPFALSELSPAPRAAMPLRARELDTEVGRAAYAMGRRRGLDEGLRSGREQGWREGAQALQDGQSAVVAETARQMQQLLQGFRAELGRLESTLSEQLVSLAVDIARQVLRHELNTDPRALLSAAAEALRSLGEGAGRIELRVNPQDAAALKTHLEALPGLAPWQLVEDESLQRGGCLVEADTGLADARLESRWQAVMEALGRPEETLP